MGKQRVLNYLIDAAWKGKGEVRAAQKDMASLGPAGKEGAAGAKGLEGALGGLGKVAGGLVGAGLLLKLGAEARQFAEESLAAASDAEESYAKFETVFRETAGVVEVELANIAAATGRSKFDLIDYAATLQDTFVPLGFARDQAAELSTTLVQLAIDLASFNNLNTDEVVRDLQSALVGNTETLRKYGVVATQAAIEAKALADGLWDGTGAIDAQAKAAAILAITLDSTTDAQGDAARTIDSYANKQRAAEAATQDLQVATGQLLSNWGEARIAAQLLTTQGILRLVTGLSELVTGAQEAAEAVDTLIERDDIDELEDYLVTLNRVKDQIRDIGPIGTPFAPVATVETREALLRLLADAGKSAETFTDLQAIMRGLGAEVDDLGVRVEGMGVSWIELQRAIDAARLADEFAAIDAALGPVDEKLRNLGQAVDGVAKAGPLFSEEDVAQARAFKEALEDGTPAAQAYAAAVREANAALSSAVGSALAAAEAVRQARAEMGEAFTSEFDASDLSEQEQAVVDFAGSVGVAASTLLDYAGNTTAAQEAMEQVAFDAKAQELQNLVNEGILPAQQAVNEFIEFMDGFDLDSWLQSQNVVGSGEQSSEAIKDQMLGYVEGIDAVAAEAATAAGTETQKVIDLATDLEGPWPYTIDTSGVQAAIGDTQKLLDLVKELEGAWAFAGGSSSGIPGGGGVPGGPGDVPGSGGGPGGGAAVSGLPPGFDFPPASSPSTGSGAGVTSTQPPLTVQVFAAPGMSPAAVADLVMYEISQYGYQLRG